VRAEDAAKYGLIWLKPAPMNNSYGFAMTRKESERLHITKLSQVESLPVKERTFCVESEFANRNDGFEPMLKHYGIPLGSGVPRDNIRTLDTGAVYAATDKGDCRFGEIFTTDGRIKSLDLVVLQDDKRYFPAYNVAPVISKKVLDKYPQLRDLLQPVSDEPRPLRDELSLKLLFLETSDIEAISRQIKQQRSIYLTRLAKIVRRRKRLEKAGLGTKVMSLVMDGAEMRVHADLAWLEHMERTLAIMQAGPRGLETVREPRR